MPPPPPASLWTALRLTDLAWAMDGSVNLSCLPADRSDKVMFSGDLYVLALGCSRGNAFLQRFVVRWEQLTH